MFFQWFLSVWGEAAAVRLGQESVCSQAVLSFLETVPGPMMKGGLP